MEKELNIIKEEVTKALKDMSIIVDEVSYRKEKKYGFLTIVLDKVNGIDLDTIVEATHIINPILDKLDLIEDSYILDVISKEKGGKYERP